MLITGSEQAMPPNPTTPGRCGAGGAATLLVVLAIITGSTASCGEARPGGGDASGLEVTGEWRGRTTAMGGYELFHVAGDTLVHGYFEEGGADDLRRYRVEAEEPGQLRLVDETSGFVRRVRYDVEGDILYLTFDEGGSAGVLYRKGSVALEEAEQGEEF